MAETCDVVIGGGAVMGSSVAYHLAAQAGFSGRILVIDKDMTYAKAASSLSLSSVRQQFSSPINIRVGLYGVAFLRAGAPKLWPSTARRRICRSPRTAISISPPRRARRCLRENHAAQTRRRRGHRSCSIAEELERRFRSSIVEASPLAALGQPAKAGSTAIR